MAAVSLQCGSRRAGQASAYPGFQASFSVREGDVYCENRYRRLLTSNEARAGQLPAKLEADVARQRAAFEQLAQGDDMQKTVANQIRLA